MATEAKAQTNLKSFHNIFSLDGKVVLVTGGSRGLGLHAASGSVLSPPLLPPPPPPPPFPPSAQKSSRKPNLSFHDSFLQAGCSKVYITSRKAAACASACEALNALPTKRPGAVAISVPADSSRMEDLEALVRVVGKTTEHVDILFANAGATWGAAFDRHPDGAFGKVMDLNVKSVFNTIRLYGGPLLMMCNRLDILFGATTLCEIVALSYDLI